MTDISRHIESQEKFHHLFVGINGAILAAAIQTARFPELGKWGISLELAGWIVLGISLVISLTSAWKIKDLFYRSMEAERAAEMTSNATEPGTVIFLENRLETFVRQVEAYSAELKMHCRMQFIFFTLGIVLIGVSRSIIGIMKLRVLFSA